MNLILLSVLIAEACLGLCAWLSPECLRWLAAHLLTRADVIELVKKESARRLQFWARELGSTERSDQDSGTLQEVRAFARR
jgi:hypothetical protein